jgi:hypothetical protein
MPDDAAFTPPPEIDTLDADLAIAEARLAKLCRLSERGMVLVERLVDATDASAPEAPAPRLDPADAFAKLSRGIRFTIALEAKIHEELRALRNGVVIERKTRAKKAADRADIEAKARREMRYFEIIEVVMEAAEREVECLGEMGLLMGALDERLNRDGTYAHFEDLPMTDVVKQLCKDLDLHPDWSLWTGKDWGPKEPFPKTRKHWSPFRNPSREPIYDENSEAPLNLWGKEEPDTAPEDPHPD